MSTTDEKSAVREQSYQVWLPPEVVSKIQGQARWVNLNVASKEDLIQYYIDGELVSQSPKE